MSSETVLNPDDLFATIAGIETGLDGVTEGENVGAAIANTVDVHTGEVQQEPDVVVLTAAEMKPLTLRNKDFVKFGALPKFINGLKASANAPFVRVKLEASNYVVGRVAGTVDVEPYSVHDRQLDYHVQLDCISHAVSVAAVSNAPPQDEEVALYWATQPSMTREQVDALVHDVTKAIGTMRSTVVDNSDEARTIRQRNSALGTQSNIASTMTSLQRQLSLAQVIAASDDFGGASTQLESQTQAVLGEAVDAATLAKLHVCEQAFAEYIKQNHDSRSTALMRDLTIRNRQKNNISTVRAVENFKKYKRAAAFEQEGLLWEVDRAKRDKLCREYDDIADKKTTAEDLLPEDLKKDRKSVV